MTLEKYFKEYRDLGRRQFKLDVQPNPNDMGVVITIHPEGTEEDKTVFFLRDELAPADGYLRETQNILFAMESKPSRAEQQKFLEESIKRLFQEAIAHHVWSSK